MKLGEGADGTMVGWVHQEASWRWQLLAWISLGSIPS
jgi:hypothetical protein